MATTKHRSETPENRMYMTCRKCGSRAERVPRGFIVRHLFGWLSLRKFHCSKCVRNFYTKS